MTLTRTALIGIGGIARHHIRQMLKQQDTTQTSVMCEPSAAMAARNGAPVDCR